MARREQVDSVVYETVSRHSVGKHAAMQVHSNPLHGPKHSHTYNIVGADRSLPQKLVDQLLGALPGAKITPCGDPGAGWASAHKLTVPRSLQMGGGGTLVSRGSTLTTNSVITHVPRSKTPTPVKAAPFPPPIRETTPIVQQPRANTPLLARELTPPAVRRGGGKTPAPEFREPIKAPKGLLTLLKYLWSKLPALIVMIPGICCVTGCIRRIVFGVIFTVVIGMVAVGVARWYMCHQFDGDRRGGDDADDATVEITSGLCRMFTNAVVSSVNGGGGGRRDDDNGDRD